MKLSFRNLFALSLLAITMGVLAAGCSKPADEPTAAPTPPANSVAKPDGGGAATPPKTHD